MVIPLKKVGICDDVSHDVLRNILIGWTLNLRLRSSADRQYSVNECQVGFASSPVVTVFTKLFSTNESQGRSWT